MHSKSTEPWTGDEGWPVARGQNQRHHVKEECRGWAGEGAGAACSVVWVGWWVGVMVGWWVGWCWKGNVCHPNSMAKFTAGDWIAGPGVPAMSK